MTALFDSHVHLDHDDVDTLALRGELAEMHGLCGAVIAGYDPASVERARTLCGRGPGSGGRPLWWSAGLHPWWMASQTPQAREAAWQHLRAWVADGELVAVGEIGLDRKVRVRLPMDEQALWMRRGLALARDAALAVILHVPGGPGRALEAVRPFARPELGVVHRYGGSPAHVGPLVDMGLCLSLGVDALAWPDGKLAGLARAIPPDRLLIETDWTGDALGYGAAHRALERLAAQIAAARGETAEIIGRQTADNAVRLFRLDRTGEGGQWRVK